jgi:CheY-like chemotaxis protein
MEKELCGWDEGEQLATTPLNYTRSILLVDDSMPILKVTSSCLRREGFRVSTAVNGSEALSVLTKGRACFSLVLMDLQMPVMDGLEAVRRFRVYESEKGGVELGLQWNGERRLPIIAMSANDSEEVRAEAARCGFDDFIPKPFSMASFRSIYLTVMSTISPLDETVYG